jgi:hypothetical protein
MLPASAALHNCCSRNWVEMTSVVVPLSAGNIKTLTRQLKEFASYLRLDAAGDVERAVAVPIAEMVRNNISGIADVDGNYLGSDNPNASVVVEIGLPGHDVIWRGEQIEFLEFGTGAAGVGYPGPAMGMAGYAPDPTKKSWAYLDAKLGGTESYGLPAQAPMYKASVQMRVVDTLTPARMMLREEARRAVTV